MSMWGNIGKTLRATQELLNLVQKIYVTVIEIHSKVMGETAAQNRKQEEGK